MVNLKSLMGKLEYGADKVIFAHYTVSGVTTNSASATWVFPNSFGSIHPNTYISDTDYFAWDINGIRIKKPGRYYLKLASHLVVAASTEMWVRFFEYTAQEQIGSICRGFGETGSIDASNLFVLNATTDMVVIPQCYKNATGTTAFRPEYEMFIMYLGPVTNGVQYYTS